MGSCCGAWKRGKELVLGVAPQGRKMAGIVADPGSTVDSEPSCGRGLLSRVLELLHLYFERSVIEEPLWSSW